MHPRWMAMGLVALCGSASAQELLPIEDFARSPKFEQIALSPDGECLAFVREDDGVKRLFFAELPALKMAALELPKTKFQQSEMQVSRFQWIGDRRVVFWTNAGLAAVDRDRKAFSHFGWQDAKKGARLGPIDAWFGEVIHVCADGRNVLAANYRTDAGVDRRNYPDASMIDTKTGIGSTVASNPGKVTRWIADNTGKVRVGISITKSGETVVYRADEKQSWRTLTGGARLPWEPVGFTEDNKQVYVSLRPESGGGGISLLNPETNEIGAAVWKNPVYAPRELVFDRATHQLAGVRYDAEQPRTQWFDERYSAIQSAVDKVLPGHVNVLASFSTDLKRVLVRSFSDRAPEVTYLFDVASGDVREIGKSRSWVNPAAMGKTRAISFASRDGIRLYGYLTVPANAAAGPLPLVMLLPSSRKERAVWGFDPLVQMLASRGWAVLQVNARGCAGYTTEFERLGDGQTGGKIQDDFVDGVRWAVAKEIADPSRLAVVGSEYGGFSALHLLANEASLFRAGVALSPITDWKSYLDDLNSDLGGLRLRNHEREKRLTDFTMSVERLGVSSPVANAKAIQAPVLVIAFDRPYLDEWERQSDRMVAALKSAGNSVEAVSIEDGWSPERSRTTQYRAIEAFLAKHLGGAVGPVATAQK